jgi:23S rRNA U2552 (ribose-2'-O)-methylase RlmE/FtsJ
MHSLFVYELDIGNSDILEKSSKINNLTTSSTINIPLISLGFHYYFHRTKDAMTITEKLETKNKFYNVMNPFEHVISNYDESLINLTKLYFNNKDKAPEIMSRGFYKMWEILYLFGIGDTKNLSYASIANTPESFIQAIIHYRQKFKDGITNDKIYSVLIHSNKDKYTEMNMQFLGFYNKQYKNVFSIVDYRGVKKIRVSKAKLQSGGKSKETDDKSQETDDTESSETPKKIKDTEITKKKKLIIENTGGSSPVGVSIKNIIQIDTIKLFKKDIEKTKKYLDLITSDGKIKIDDINTQEQESYQLILSEIIAALKVQAINGSFVLKVFETFTIPTLKLIYLLSSFYKNTYIYKPFYSRSYNSEKYIICKDFQLDQVKDAEQLKVKIKTLETVLAGMDTNKFVYDIFPTLKLPDEYLYKMKLINIKIANTQQIMINEIVKYIKENNYFGEKYHTQRDIQIQATKWWVSSFFPPDNLYNKSKEDLIKIMNTTLEKNKAEQMQFISSLVKN